MKIACKLASEVLDYITPYVKSGVSTDKLNNLCHEYMVFNQKTIPAPLNYSPPGHPPFPKSICTSVNHVICHGIPSEKILKKGDSLNIDITVIKDGFHGDCSRMFHVGDPTIKALKLSNVTYEAMWRGIEVIKPGKKLGDIGYEIQSYAESEGFSIVREFCGHGIGLNFHEDPQVLHYGKKNTGIELKPGMTFTVEPMVNEGKPNIRILSDQWTVVTKDKKLSAQWEHTVLVTDGGYEVLTLSENSPKKPI